MTLHVVVVAHGTQHYTPAARVSNREGASNGVMVVVVVVFVRARMMM